ncbi:MAG: GTPase domain-containing protein [Candidatus Hodarchaeales archaeon]|jgi:GTPase SAR1 family protein
MYSFSSDRPTNFIGKIAAIGQGGSGKTYMINKLSNYLAGKEIFPWNEEKNLAGTIGVTPYTLDFQGGRVIINDNPGQNSLELVRTAIAKQGDVYQGLVIVADALGWNFRKLGVYHAESIRQYSQLDDMPISIIISKRDLSDFLYQHEDTLRSIALLIEDTVLNANNGQQYRFHDRAFNRDTSFKLELEDEDLIPFTNIEQIIVNRLDDWVKEYPVFGLTPMNIRLLTRSLLLGYCDLIKNAVDQEAFPQFKAIQDSFEAIDEDLVNRLNYHRPTAYETHAHWIKLAGSDPEGNPKKNEPPIIKSMFSFENVITVLKEFVLASENKVKNYVNGIKKYGKKMKWTVVNYAFTDSVTNHGQRLIHDTVQGLIQEMAKRNKKKEAEVDLSLDGLGLDNF